MKGAFVIRALWLGSDEQHVLFKWFYERKWGWDNRNRQPETLSSPVPCSEARPLQKPGGFLG
ncbi:hypothetical protein DSLASN_02270 [Desulfoluna limicola]|uniref:Uncharacterized protein n=1 Tax=Desulfoluna limicola TaxID=2810562 RepID=A0ABM7PBM7_9BACT|nr:hypothetical protein DSLASN_02270 [Desulfoluna limicola]